MRVNVNVVKIFVVDILGKVLSSILSTYFGYYIFVAAGIANRLWALSVLLLFLKYFYHAALSNAVYLYVLVAYTAYGFLRGNSLANIAADFYLMFLPLVFYTFAKKKGFILSNLGRQIVWPYLLGSLALLPLGFLAKCLFNVSAVGDYVLILVVLFIELNMSGLTSVLINLIYLGFLIVIGVTGKIVVVQYLMGLVLAKRKKFVKLISWLVLICVTGIVLSPLIMQAKVFRKSSSFIQSFSILGLEEVKGVVEEPSLVFRYYDSSTAQRLYEFFAVVDENGGSFFTFLFGQGLGGSVNLSESKDGAFILAHRGNLDVRVIHMGIPFLFLKFGIVGIIFFLYAAIVLVRRLVKAWRRVKYNARLIGIFRMSVIYLILVSVGLMFTFSNFMKLPLLGIVLFAVSNKKSLKLSFQENEV